MALRKTGPAIKGQGDAAGDHILRIDISRKTKHTEDPALVSYHLLIVLVRNSTFLCLLACFLACLIASFLSSLILFDFSVFTSLSFLSNNSNIRAFQNLPGVDNLTNSRG